MQCHSVYVCHIGIWKCKYHSTYMSQWVASHLLAQILAAATDVYTHCHSCSRPHSTISRNSKSDIAVVEYGIRAFAVPTRLTCFLQICFNIRRCAPVDDSSKIKTIKSHSESNCCHHNPEYSVWVTKLLYNMIERVG